MSNVEALSPACAEFGLNIYKTIASSSEVSNNVFLSPFCLHSVLSMAYLGTDGKTKEEIASTLKLESLTDRVSCAYREFLTKVPIESVNIANRLYLQATATILDSFKQTCKTDFSADAVSSKFDVDAEAERKTINGWVKDETKGKIEDLIPVGALSTDTIMVLVNAIYFKDDWDVKFDAAETTKGTFKLNDKDTIEVDFMRRSAMYNFGFSQELNSQILELPYRNKKLSMFAILPYDGLKGLEEKLTASSLSALEKSMDQIKVEVCLPKFKITSSMQLVDTLQSMGVQDAFIAGKADFSKVDGTKNICISNIFHKAFIVVDETGSEAAAAGGLVIESRSLPPSFNADQPFMFYIKDNSSGMILFLGRVSNPDSQ